MKHFVYQLQREELWLLPLRAIFWPKQQALLLSDIHLGKAGHFRKNGIAIPKKVHQHDLFNISLLIQTYRPLQVFFLGDLFHSVQNQEWQDFLDFLEDHIKVRFTLVEGNHDLIKQYPESLAVVKSLDLGPFHFSHIPEESLLYNLAGHIHPGFSVRGNARQGFTLPCFVFGKRSGLLPAFGQFTGLKKIKPSKSDRIFVIAEEQVFQLK